jgi:hypothetical protein
MSYSIPTELANARIARDTAWDKYDAALGTPFQPELWKVVNWLEERATALYNEWQQQGGTSDIEVLSFATDPRNEAKLWDFTPVQNMPIIDMDKIEEIPL